MTILTMSYFKLPHRHPSAVFGRSSEHFPYVSPVQAECDDLYFRAQRGNYIANMEEWMKRSVYNSYGRDGYVGLDEHAEVRGNWRYGRRNGADVDAPNRLDRTTNRDVIMYFVSRLQRIVRGHGYTIANQNQFKDDIVYSIYRLSKP